jgi:hypothetical protein
MYRCRETLEIESESVGELVLGRLASQLWYNNRSDCIDGDESKEKRKEGVATECE